ncbi:MAG: hypothetical protein ABI780_08770 [Ardenticatenales bacterium]
MSRSPSGTLRVAAWPALALSAAAIAAVGAALAWFAARDPLRRSWAAADGRAYSVVGGTDVDVDGQRMRYRVEGAGDGRGGLTLRVAPLGHEDDPATFDIAWPEVRAADGITLPQRALGVRLPVGDPLILLATAHAPRPGGLEPVGERLCRRVDFVLGARAYGTWWEAHPRYLPVNANAGGLWTFEGSGTAWIEPATSLPCRIVAEVALPRLGDDVPGRGEADWVYAWKGEARAP